MVVEAIWRWQRFHAALWYHPLYEAHVFPVENRRAQGALFWASLAPKNHNQNSTGTQPTITERASSTRANKKALAIEVAGAELAVHAAVIERHGLRARGDCVLRAFACQLPYSAWIWRYSWNCGAKITTENQLKTNRRTGVKRANDEQGCEEKQRPVRVLVQEANHSER